MADNDPVPAGRYCKACYYDLHGLIGQRCSECGLVFDLGDPRTYSTRPRPADFLEKVAGVFDDLAGPLFETPTDQRQGRQVQNLLVHMAALRDENERLRTAVDWVLAVLRERAALSEAEAETLEALLQPPLEVIEPVKQPTAEQIAERLNQVQDDTREDEPH